MLLLLRIHHQLKLLQEQEGPLTKVHASVRHRKEQSQGEIVDLQLAITAHQGDIIEGRVWEALEHRKKQTGPCLQC